MFKKFFLVLLVMTPFSNAMANGIDFRVGGDAAELTFLSESSTFGYGGADIGVGVFFDDADNLIVSGSIIVSGNSLGNVQGLNFGVGVKAFAGSIDLLSDTGAAIALGVAGRYVFPGPTPLAIMFEAYAAPSVSSLADFDGIAEYRAAFEMEVTPSARAYVGYRNMELDTNTAAGIQLDDDLHFGVRFSF